MSNNEMKLIKAYEDLREVNQVQDYLLSIYDNVVTDDKKANIEDKTRREQDLLYKLLYEKGFTFEDINKFEPLFVEIIESTMSSAFKIGLKTGMGLSKELDII